VLSPGVLRGGRVKPTKCDMGRCLSYYLEPLIYLAPFCKLPVDVTLDGVTNMPSASDPSVDALRDAWVPAMRRFLQDNADALAITVERRGYLPDGGGRVHFKSPICRRSLSAIDVSILPKVRRIRGSAHGAKLSPTMLNRMISGARTLLQGYLADIYMVTDYRQGITGGNSPGFGLCLRAETTDDHCVYVGEAMSRPRGSTDPPSVPEDVGALAAKRLLDEICRGGACDSSAQMLVALCMTLGQTDLSTCVVGPLTEYTVETLRHLHDFMNVKFQLSNFDIPKVQGDDDEQDEHELQMGSTNKVKLACIGAGYTNLAKVTL